MYFWQFHLGSALYKSEVSVFVRTNFATFENWIRPQNGMGRVHLQEAAVEKEAMARGPIKFTDIAW
jgi:hypothetical protein